MSKNAKGFLWHVAVAGNLVAVLAACFLLWVTVEEHIHLAASRNWNELMILVALFVIPTLSLSALVAFRPGAENRRAN